MKCKIRWIDKEGNPTPDDNEAVGYTRCLGYPVKENPSYKPEPFSWFPICAEHLARMPKEGWEFKSYIPVSKHELKFTCGKEEEVEGYGMVPCGEKITAEVHGRNPAILITFTCLKHGALDEFIETVCAANK